MKEKKSQHGAELKTHQRKFPETETKLTALTASESQGPPGGRSAASSRHYSVAGLVM